MVPKRCWPERSLCTNTAEVSDTFHIYVRWHHVPVSVWCAWLDLVLKDNEEGAQACDAHAQVHGRTADPSSNRQT